MENKPQKNKFLRLMGMGTQMGVTIFLFAYLGKYLDEQYPAEKKWFTMLCTIAGVGISLYFIVKQLNKINNEE